MSNIEGAAAVLLSCYYIFTEKGKRNKIYLSKQVHVA